MATNDMMVPAREFNANNFLPEDLLDYWIRPLIAEFLGPFALVFIGAGAILTATSQGFSNGGTLVAVALAHGLAIGLMVAGAGHISGGHYNPAVTFGLWLGGKIGTLKAIGYVIVQLAGAVVAALLLRYIYPEAVRNATHLGVPAIAYADNNAIIVGRARGFTIEVILTFFLMYVIYGTAVDERGAHAIAALAIGLTITMDIFMGGPLTGAAMNPSRHFGPALVQNDWKDTWVYWAGPLVGAGLAAIAHAYIFIPRALQEPTAQPTEHHG
ncbi:MAG TPA: MIP family channel protein [Dehalococcoidia bacterium]|jgi:aquaporin TIP|nr:MIP family channel protein [Dehalococcoidia bacterium]